MEIRQMTDQIIIDGSIGEGGGQILRTSLGLSMVTGKPVRLEKIRAGREKPGLLRQHLTALLAAASICSAEVEGAEIGSQTLSFTPGKTKPGTYTFSIGSAGSTTLVLQTVLPALLCADAPSTLVLEGGTHNPWAPPFDFLERAFLPLVNRMGPKVRVTLERAGFYPAGGGRFIVQIDPARALSPLHLLERGETRRQAALGMVAGLPGAIARRELERMQKKLGWPEQHLQIRQLPEAWGPGNVLIADVESEHVTEVFTGFGMKGVSAEGVADDVIRQVRRYLVDGAPVGPYLADQLLLPLALAGGGSFRTQSPTKHTTTNIDVIQRFLPVRISIEQSDRGCCTIRLESN
jgi:RNA 3'-terminal phosphate cyclase (ATP)